MSRWQDDPVLPEQEVRKLLERALGRLQQHWLWLDVDQDDWLDALHAFERIVREILSSGRAAAPLSGNQGALEIAGYTSGMGPLLGYWIETGKLSATAGAATVLLRHLDHNRARMASLRERSREVVGALSAARLRATVLKGMHTAFAYFPEPGTRPLSDIDVLIRPEQRLLASEVLAAIGYVAGPEGYRPDSQNWRPGGARSQPMTLRYVHALDPWSVDLQFSLNRRCTPGSPILELDGCGLPDTAVPWRIAPEGGQMGPAPLLFHLLVHSSYGLESLTMLRIVELATVTRQQREEQVLDWSAIEHFARSSGALGAMYPALRMTDMLAPGLVDSALLGRSEKAAPRAVTTLIAGLSPATAHRVTRTSIRERFMWTSSPRAIVRHVWDYLAVPHTSAARRRALYAHRLGRVKQMTIFMMEVVAGKARRSTTSALESDRHL